MKPFLFLLLLTFAGVHAQPTIPLVNGFADTIHSSILGENRPIWIGLPNSLQDKKAAPSHCPVVYLLDGDSHFSAVNAMLQQLSAEKATMMFPDMIVVAIPSDQRSRDFTPYPSPYWMYGPPSPLENPGGGEKFAAFIEKELIPAIESHYPTAPHRTLIGHSLGGLAVTNMLINHTRLFNDYIIIDPSMWYDSTRFLQSAITRLQQARFDGISVYLGIANTLQPGMDTALVRKDTTRNSFHTRAILKLKDALVKYSPANGMRFSYAYYPHESHMSAPLITEYDGFRFLFDYYSIDPGMETQWSDPDITGIHPAAQLEAHFKMVSEKIGYRLLPPENLVTLCANTFANYNMPDKALDCLLLNVRNYPNSTNAREALADYYKSRGTQPGRP